MDEQLMLGQMEEIAAGLGIEVRYETVRREGGFISGGLCRIRGKPVVIVNRKAPLSEQVEVLASALKRFDLSGVYLRPGLREYLEAAGPGRTLEEYEISRNEKAPDIGWDRATARTRRRRSGSRRKARYRGAGGIERGA